MARLARIVVPGLPHHVTRRGNRREVVFRERVGRNSLLRRIEPSLAASVCKGFRDLLQAATKMAQCAALIAPYTAGSGRLSGSQIGAK